MAASPPSPSDSFYDVSDEEEDEYKTIAQCRPERGVKLLFSKSKVRGHGSRPILMFKGTWISENADKIV